MRARKRMSECSHVRWTVAVAMLVIIGVGFGTARCMGAPIVIKVALEEGRMANVGRYVAAEYAKVNPDVKVEIVGLPDTNMYDKLLIALTSGSYVYDAIEFTPGWGAGFVKSGWLRPMDEWWDEADPYFSDFLLVDMLSKFEDAPKEWAGTYYGLPFNTDVKMLLYRKDLYEQNGLKPPTTWDEFVHNCKTLHDPSKGIYGYGYPAMVTGAGDANTAFLVHMWAGGGQFLDKTLKPTFYTPTNLKIFSDLVETIPNIAHPGMYETDYNEENEVFASGKAAHIIQWMPAAVSTVEDPKASRVVDKIGYAPVYGVSTRGTGWSTGITTSSRHPKETFEFLKFMSSPEMCKESLIRFSNSLVRKSLVDDAELVKQFPWVSGTVAALSNAQDLPTIPERPAIQEIIGIETIRALKKQVTPEQALRTMDEKTLALLKKGGYVK